MLLGCQSFGWAAQSQSWCLADKFSTKQVAQQSFGKACAALHLRLGCAVSMLLLQALLGVSLRGVHAASCVVSQDACRKHKACTNTSYVPADHTPKSCSGSWLECCDLAGLSFGEGLLQKACWWSIPCSSCAPPINNSPLKPHDCKLFSQEDVGVSCKSSKTKILHADGGFWSCWVSCAYLCFSKLPLVDQAKGEQKPKAKIRPSVWIQAVSLLCSHQSKLYLLDAPSLLPIPNLAGWWVTTLLLSLQTKLLVRRFFCRGFVLLCFVSCLCS